MRTWLPALLVASLMAAGAGLCRADEDHNNVYMAGPEVRLAAPVQGDLFAAAGRIAVDHPVSGDAVLGAGSVEVRSSIGDDLRVAGGIVGLSGKVGGEALLAGGSVAFGPETEVLGHARIAGGNIVLAGRLHNGVDVYGKNILLLGRIDGNVRLRGERIEILASAVINGNVTYSSAEEIRIHPAARVYGELRRDADKFELPRPRFDLPGMPAISPLLLLGLLAAGSLLLALFPRFTASSLRAMGDSPLKSLGLGTAVLFSLPPLILLLIITIVGIPVALALAALYAIALLVGYLLTACFIGDLLLRRQRTGRERSTGWRIGGLLAGLIVIWLARNLPLPYVSPLILLLALIIGMGAMILQAFAAYADRK